jgi:uncharacterized membrane protein
MATLTVWKFDDPGGADTAEATLEQLEKQQLVQVLDAATVSWPANKRSPKTRQLHNTARTGALGGGFWGLLFGLIFFMPLLGAAIGAAAGAVAGSLTDVGIDDRFIKDVQSQVSPGTSALFALTEGAVLERVQSAFSGVRAELIATNLSADQEQHLREVFVQ